MTYGTMLTDSRGFVIETRTPMWDKPKLIISRYRVNVMNGQPRSDSESVTYNGSWWSGYGFQCNTEQYPESGDEQEIKKPRGTKVWRDGEWRKR